MVDPLPTTDITAARILESITAAFFALDREWRFTYINAEAERLLSRTREELLGRNVWEEFPAAIGSTFKHEYRRAVDTQAAVAFEAFYPPLDTWFEARAYPSSDGLSVYFHDVSARRRAEEALRKSREDLESAVGAARLGTFYCDWPFDKITWNDICKEHFFLPPDADVDFDLFYSLLHTDDREPTRRAIDRAMAERVEYNVEYRTLAPDGRTRWIVERTLAWLSRCRAILVRYDKLAERYLALVKLACALLWFRRWHDLAHAAAEGSSLLQ